MRVTGVIQARMASTRFPGKILAPLAGLPLLAVIVERLRGAPLDELWLATTAGAADDVTAAWGEELGLRVFRGDEEDVLSRFVAVAERSAPDWMVRFTADDPFVDAAVVGLLVEQAAAAGPRVSLVGTASPARTLPLGYVPAVARAAAVVRSAAEIPADASHHRTHVLSWLRERGEAEEFRVPAGWPARPEWRWTVDTAADHEMARRVFASLGDGWRTAGYQSLVAVLDAAPDLAALNRDVRQKRLKEG